MEPKVIIIGKRRDTGKLELISDLNAPVASVESAFMPFRLKRENETYEWTHLAPLGDGRTERHTLPTNSPSVSEPSPKKAKSK